jgi:chemotaxis protein MotB
MAGKGGGAWKVAYADFVTAMMAFFMVMWICAQSKQVKVAVAQYFKEPTKSRSGDTSLIPSNGGATDQDKENTDPGLLPPGRDLGVPNVPRVTKQGGKGSGLKKPSLYVIHDGDRRMQGTVITFAEDSAELTGAAKDMLKQFATVIVGKRNKIELRGHATRRPLPPGSPYQDAWHLSYARCLAVMQFLQKENIPPERFRLTQAGVFEPYSIRVDPEKQLQNSRVEIYQLGDVADDLMGTREERAERYKTP